jgi:hypothetical protein
VKEDLKQRIYNYVHYRYQHKFENCTYICKTCHSNGKEVVVTPKLTSSTDTSWFGLAKYAWSGYVLHRIYCEGFASVTFCKEDNGTIRIIKANCNLHFI